MEIVVPKISPYILAGGMSSRMGRDKRLMSYKGMTLLERMCLLAESATGRKPVLVGDNLDAPEFTSYRCIRDAVHGQGPLGGIVAALEDSPTEWTLILPVDMPGLNPGMIESLILHIDGNSEVVLFGRDGFIETLAALYRKSALFFWQARLAGNELAPIKGIKQLRHRIVDCSADARAFVNLNRPSDLTVT
ncbi:MAG: molybdenum cofactor guanylyltransferase [FCB group bacterium]|nr:molybdenum cofactor guanylyltransferase [FCB group bacterium]